MNKSEPPGTPVLPEKKQSANTWHKGKCLLVVAVFMFFKIQYYNHVSWYSAEKPMLLHDMHKRNVVEEVHVN